MIWIGELYDLQKTSNDTVVSLFASSHSLEVIAQVKVVSAVLAAAFTVSVVV